MKQQANVDVAPVQSGSPDQTANGGTHSPGPWQTCRNGECRCGAIWTVLGDHPVANVIIGEWGDEYPSLEIEGPETSFDGMTIKPKMEKIVYGSLGKETAAANARLIAAAPELLNALRLLLADVQDYEPWQRPCRAVDIARDVLALVSGTPQENAVSK